MAGLSDPKTTGDELDGTPPSEDIATGTKRDEIVDMPPFEDIATKSQGSDIPSSPSLKSSEDPFMPLLPVIDTIRDDSLMDVFDHKTKEDELGAQELEDEIDSMPLSEDTAIERQSSNISSSSSTEASEDPLEHFVPVLNALRGDSLVSLALKTRLQRESQAPLQTIIGPLSCAIQQPPTAGSFNIFYTLLFSDGVKWIARIPGNGLEFGPLDRQGMESTIQTIFMIRSRTTIPVPEVFSWATTEEIIGVPFSLESFVPGSPLAERWTDPTWTSEEKRLKVFRDLAATMSQLAPITFNKIGTPFYYHSANSFQIEPLVFIDRDIFDENNFWGTPQAIGPFSTLQSCLADWPPHAACLHWPRRLV